MQLSRAPPASTRLAPKGLCSASLNKLVLISSTQLELVQDPFENGRGSSGVNVAFRNDWSLLGTVTNTHDKTLHFSWYDLLYANLFSLLIQKQGSSLLRQLHRATTRHLTSMPPVYSAKDNKLIHDLIRISNKSPKLIKGSDYVAPETPEMTIRSWKMNEFKYYDIPSPFPTLARGLFTTEVDQGGKRSGKEKEYRIVIRGYDKFFNIGEVPWTTVCDSAFVDKRFPQLITCRSGSLLKHIRPRLILSR